MRTSRRALAVFACALLPLPCSAAAEKDKNDAKKDLPSAGGYLKLVLSNLKKVKSYRVALTVEGGTSDEANHKITQRTVHQSYRGNVYQNTMMHVPAHKVYRTLKKGVRYTRGDWRNILADRQGVLLDRLFDFPFMVLVKAARHSKKAEWVEKPKSREKKSSRKSRKSQKKKKSSKQDDDEDGKRGRTVVRRSKSKRTRTSLPSVIRVEVPREVALKHFLTVERSGCIGGG